MYSKHSPKIKREPCTPPDSNKRRRITTPILLGDKKDIKPKHSRLSSPILLDDDRDYNEDRRKIKPDPDSNDRYYANHHHSLHHSHRGRHDYSDNRRDYGRRGNDSIERKPIRTDESKSASKSAPKDTVNFELSGKLAADTNSYKGVVIKYNEPEDARKPTRFWRLYPFKGNEPLKVMHIHRQSGYLIGSDTRVVEIPMLHPSISKQHAALQFRFTKGKERLYVIDLESTNGTYLNGNKIETRRYYELREKDVLKFGYSSREYVVMTDKVDSEEEDDVE